MFKFVLSLTFGTLPSIGNAATILFEDLTDNVSVVTTAPNRVTNLNCGGDPTNEFCNLDLSAPPGAISVSAPQNVGFAEGPGPSLESDDILAGIGVGGSFVVVEFASFDPGPNFALCNAPPPSTICGVENGTVQTAFQLSWSDGTVDTIQFQSDVEPAPEPATMLLLAAGLAGLLARSALVRQSSRVGAG